MPKGVISLNKQKNHLFFYKIHCDPLMLLKCRAVLFFLCFILSPCLKMLLLQNILY